MGGIEIIPYNPELRSEVAELFCLLVSRDPAEARRYLEWKYEENPYIGEPVLYLARANGRLVGTRGLCGAPHAPAFPVSLRPSSSRVRPRLGWSPSTASPRS